ncbi:MAG: TetR/AcrR family transcriptional regulator [Tenericutes bacterium]|jgi:AcrR family transcriptional regulator|nr:TetR/AcrR family transcriptional regulator [Mycoplasmatota bacterium]
MPKQTFFNLKKEKKEKIIQAAIQEFSTKSYELVNLSDIIKQAGIPRGSFYQYFEDKRDIYFHLIDIIKKTKMSYLSDLYTNQDIPFLDWVEVLYSRGVIFALEQPKFVQIMDLLLKNKNDIYVQLIKDGKDFAIQYYSGLIEKDKEKGLLRKDIHTKTLAVIVSDLTTNVTIKELDTKNPEESYQMMKQNIHHILYILKKGIENNG